MDLEKKVVCFEIVNIVDFGIFNFLHTLLCCNLLFTIDVRPFAVAPQLCNSNDV